MHWTIGRVEWEDYLKTKNNTRSETHFQPLSISPSPSASTFSHTHKMSQSLRMKKKKYRKKSDSLSGNIQEDKKSLCKFFSEAINFITERVEALMKNFSALLSDSLSIFNPFYYTLKWYFNVYLHLKLKFFFLRSFSATSCEYFFNIENDIWLALIFRLISRHIMIIGMRINEHS